MHILLTHRCCTHVQTWLTPTHTHTYTHTRTHTHAYTDRQTDRHTHTETHYTCTHMALHRHKHLRFQWKLSISVGMETQFHPPAGYNYTTDKQSQNRTVCSWYTTNLLKYSFYIACGKCSLTPNNFAQLYII